MQLLRFLVIVFTHGDSLGDLPEDQKEEELKAILEDSPPKLRELLDVSCCDAGGGLSAE